MKQVVGLLVVGCCAASVLADPYLFQSASGTNAWIEVDAWAGSGANESVLVVDWNFMGGPYQTESHAFGFRWNGTAYESDMLNAFHDAGIFTVTSGFGGAFLLNIAYNDGTEAHLHTEEGSWNLASTTDPYAQWGAMSSDWTKLGDWDANMVAYDAELLQNGCLEGINAIYWFGSYPTGQTYDDYPLNVPFASVPEPSALALCVLGGGLWLFGRKRRPSVMTRTSGQCSAASQPRPGLALPICSAAVLTSSAAFAGPYSTTGISQNDASFVEWATGCTVTRGYQNIATKTAYASYGTDSVGTGKAGNGANSSVVSLGDAGYAILTFDTAIYDGTGYDFAVFENGFASGSGRFCELALVEVSSDGVNFFRFPSVSLTSTDTQVGSFGTIDPSNLYNLAGKDLAGYGTGFDLSELAGASSLLDINDVKYVKVVDVVGSIDSAYASYDSLGNIINDPWPTAFASSGFDLDAVGVIHAVPEPSVLALSVLGGAFLLRRRIQG